MGTGTGKLREYHVTVDDFKQPKKSEGRKAIGVLIIRLILLEPGTDPVRPEMGLGIVSKYRYMQKDGMDELASNLQQQLSKYLVPYSNVTVEMTMNDNLQLTFDIHIDESTYKYITSQQESNKITISEL